MAKAIANQVLPLKIQIQFAINQAISLREKNQDNGSVFYIVSPPGIGKTQMSYEFCKNSNIGLISCTPALERQEKFGGIPDLKYVKGGVEFMGTTHSNNMKNDPESENEDNFKNADEEYLITKWSVPDLIAKANMMSLDHEYVLILLDDWHLCAPNIQQIGFELFTHRSLNGCKLADNIVFLLAGNQTSAAGAKVQMSAILNRSVVLHAKADINDWLAYAERENLHPACFGFFSSIENQAYFQEEESTSSPFGSPRSWTTFFRNLSLIEENLKYYNFPKSYNKKLTLGTLQGCVSQIAAEKFHIFYEIFSQVDLDKIFSKGYGDGPAFAQVPTDLVAAYAHVYAVTSKFYDLYIQCSITDDKKEKANIDKYSKIWYQMIEILFNKKESSSGKSSKSELAMKSVTMLAAKQATIIEGKKIKGGNLLIADLLKKNIIPKDLLASLEDSRLVLGRITKS